MSDSIYLANTRKSPVKYSGKKLVKAWYENSYFPKFLKKTGWIKNILSF